MSSQVGGPFGCHGTHIFPFLTEMSRRQLTDFSFRAATQQENGLHEACEAVQVRPIL